MTLIQFADKLNNSSEKSAIKALICEFINNHADQCKETDAKTFVDQLQDDRFTDFGNKLGYCRNYCRDELKNDDNKEEETYLVKLKKVSSLLELLSKVYQDVINLRKAAMVNANETAALSQQRGVLSELNEKIKSLKTEYDSIKTEIGNLTDSFNDKIFSVMINTVAILGIFVTIAFAGFGVATIFSNIDLKTALSSEEAFVKNVFYTLLTTCLSYNLLLLLIYFIFKISRPIFAATKDNRTDANSISQSVNIKSFIWIDIFLCMITIITLVICILVW